MAAGILEWLVTHVSIAWFDADEDAGGLVGNSNEEYDKTRAADGW